EDTTADLFMSKTVRRTDSRGEVRFVDLRPGSHLVSSWVNSFEHVLLQPGADHLVDLVVAPQLRLRGRVIDTEGRGIPDAELWADDHDASGPALLARSDDDGNYQVVSGGLGVTFFARKPGYLASDAEAFALGDVEADFILEPALGRLRGVVRDAEGRAIEGATLIAETRWPAGTPKSAGNFGRDRLRWPIERSRQDGTFEFESLPAEMIRVHASKDGFGPCSVQVSASPDHFMTCEVTLGRGATLHGRVTDSELALLSNAEVFVHLPSPYPKRIARTDDLGEFHVHGLPVGTTSLLARHQTTFDGEYEIEIRTLDESLTLDVHLPITRPQRGIVTAEDGSAIPGVLVHAYQSSLGSTMTLSDPRGRFELRMSARAPTTVEVYESNQGELLTVLSLENVTRSDEDLRLVIPDMARATGAVHALVIRPEFYAKEPITVSLMNADGQLVRLVPVSLAGELRALGVQAGSYSLQTSGSGSPFHGDELGSFTLHAGQQLDLGTIRLAAPVIPELVARTTNGRRLEELTGRLHTVPDGEARSRLGLFRGGTTWEPPLAEGEYVFRIQDGDGYLGRDVPLSLRRGPPNRIEVELQSLQRARIALVAADGSELPKHLSFRVTSDRGVEAELTSKENRLELSLATGSHRVRVLDQWWSGEVTIHARAESEDILQCSLELRMSR
ncbi:MAG: carboxypeptidase-like regulatory domain-containing protein, partial [Planctomycetota bacterium]